MDIEQIIAKRRLELSGKPGIRGLLDNGRTTAIAVFASLGGLIYGFNQGLFGQILSMHSFGKAIGVGKIADNPTLLGLLTSILELGAWVGVLANGYLADKIGRKGGLVIGVVMFCVGVIVQASTRGGNYDYILAGRFVTGMGVGSLSMVVPLYNAEVSPPEIRGSLVAVQQLAITFGIMISYWITYGTNYIGGTGETQSEAAWLVPICIQILPALILAFGVIMFMPSSPRWLMDVGREDDCLNTLATLRRLSPSHPLVRMEFLEIKCQKIFEKKLSERDFPHLQDGSAKSNFLLFINGYKSMILHWPSFKRLSIACLIMMFQQFTGVNFILYYAPFIFKSLGLTGNTISLLASGVVGVVMFLATIPTVLFVDQVGRKPILISGAIIMGVCHFIVAGIIGQLDGKFATHAAAGWVACVFVWIFAIAFGYSWGPVAWVLVAESFALGQRARGISIGASSNWLCNFAVAISTPDFVAKAGFGAYVFLGVMCILGAAYVYYFTPETKNKSLEELDEAFGDTSGTAKKERDLHIKIMHEVGLLELAGVPEENFGEGKNNEYKKNVELRELA